MVYIHCYSFQWPRSKLAAWASLSPVCWATAATLASVITTQQNTSRHRHVNESRCSCLLLLRSRRMISLGIYIWKGVLLSVVFLYACDWTTGRKRSHSNSNQLTDKWIMGCCIIFMATDDVTERVIYKRCGSACCVCTEKNYSKSALAKRLYHIASIF